MPKSEVLFDPANVIGIGDDVHKLTAFIVFALNGEIRPCITHVRPVPGLDRSVRFFGKNQFHESVSTPWAFTPEEMAKTLVRYSDANPPEEPARYPLVPITSLIKGWTISRCPDDFVDETGFPLVIAYATWIG